MPPQSVAIFRCAENTLRARVRVCLGGSGAEKEAWRGGGSGTGAPTAPAPQDSPPHPLQPPPAAACAVWGCFQSTPNSIHFGSSVHPPAPRVHTPHAESQAPALPLHRQPGRPPPSPGQPLSPHPSRSRGLLRVILGGRRHLRSVSLPPWVASPVPVTRRRWSRLRIR